MFRATLILAAFAALVSSSVAFGPSLGKCQSIDVSSLHLRRGGSPMFCTDERIRKSSNADNNMVPCHTEEYDGE